MRRSLHRSLRRSAQRLRRRVLGSLLMTLVGALLLSGCDFSVYSLPLPGGADVGDDPITVKVKFRDVLDLVPQSSVKVDDVSVGRVEKVDVVDDYAAEVTLTLRKSVKLPDNATAQIRQTSLLGEKFVSLAPPAEGASSGRLGNGDVIPLSRSGRNPEVEEVLGALSLLLNGGGVAQLKMIASELNKALDGRETDVRSLLTQVDVLMSQLDTGKDEIVRAIESLNRLAVALNKQKPAITQALDELPRAIASINRQRDDLVKMLKALSNLSDVGTRVIRQSKTATVDSLQALAPTLTSLAKTGQSLPKALQVFLTYPFVDAVVGKNPAQARNLHMGDYTNLSIKLDLDLTGVGGLCDTLEPLKDLPVNICQNPALEQCLGSVLKADPDLLQNGTLEEIVTAVTKCSQGAKDAICELKGSAGPLGGILGQLCDAVPGGGVELPLKVSVSALTKCLTSGKPTGAACDRLNPLTLVQRCAATSKKKKPSGYYSETCKRFRKLNLGITNKGVIGKLPVVGGGSGGSGGSGGGGGVLGGLGGGLGGLGRAAVGSSDDTKAAASGRTSNRSDLGAMLVWGMMPR